MHVHAAVRMLLDCFRQTVCGTKYVCFICRCLWQEAYRVAIPRPVNEEEHADVVHSDAFYCCVCAALHHDPMRASPPQLQRQTVFSQSSDTVEW